MNTIPEQYFAASKEFRAYMQKKKGEKGQFLSNLMAGAEIHLTRIIKTNIAPSYTILYDKTLSIKVLVHYYATIESHEEWLTISNGHTAWKSLRYYIIYRSEIEGIDWHPIYELEKKKINKQN